MSGRDQVRISGFGGQGVVLLGLLLGEAGGILGKNVAGANSYGAQARGSGCKSEVVFSNEPIDFPHVVKADYFIAMSQGSYDLYCATVAPGGLIIYDASQVRPTKELHVRQAGIPATDTAISRLNDKQAANMVLLGALVEMSDLVSSESIEKAMERHVAERFRAQNLRAFEIGRELARRDRG